MPGSKPEEAFGAQHAAPLGRQGCVPQALGVEGPLGVVNEGGDTVAVGVGRGVVVVVVVVGVVAAWGAW